MDTMTAYRYTLRRGGWDEPDLFDHVYVNGCLCWVMLNPSTADDDIDDPTIRRCTRFTKDNGYDSLEVVNLFAARATEPHALIDLDDPIGPDNDGSIDTALMKARAVVFAWGSFAHRDIDVLGRAAQVWARCRLLRHTPLCLGTTKDGSPRHPLYVAADQPLVAWR